MNHTFSKLLLCFGIVLALMLTPAATYPQEGASVLHYVAGTYVAQAYSTWQDQVIGGPHAAGTVSIAVANPTVCLADGYCFMPFSTSNPINIGQGPDSETVTPSAVSGCNQGGSCTITATFAKSHGQGDIIASGSAGIDDAVYDAANHGGGQVFGPSIAARSH